MMEIKGVVHCFFEQSGTFKNEFKKLGYSALDYDIQNNFPPLARAYKGGKWSLQNENGSFYRYSVYLIAKLESD